MFILLLALVTHPLHSRAHISIEFVSVLVAYIFLIQIISVYLAGPTLCFLAASN
jgi:hypothetical protein